MNTTQAVVAIGGKASRLRSGGVPVPVSKSFLTVQGKPLLHWVLRSLHTAGVRRVVLCADADIQFLEANAVLRDLGVTFASVDRFADAGLGVHGLPYQARRYLDDMFLFECGHNISEPTHYAAMDRAKSVDNIVVSAFRPHPDNPRQPVTLRGRYVRKSSAPRRNAFAVAHPFLVDQDYAAALPRLQFRIDRIITHYTGLGRMRYVASNLPPEFDLAEEFSRTMPVYEEYLTGAKLDLISGGDHSGGSTTLLGCAAEAPLRGYVRPIATSRVGIRASSPCGYVAGAPALWSWARWRRRSDLRRGPGRQNRRRLSSSIPRSAP